MTHENMTSAKNKSRPPTVFNRFSSTKQSQISAAISNVPPTDGIAEEIPLDLCVPNELIRNSSRSNNISRPHVMDRDVEL